MGQTIQIRRGREENLPTLAVGELALTTDTKKVFIGTPTGNEKVGVSEAEGIVVADTNNHFTSNNLEGILEELFTNVSDGKIQVRNAITGKGGTVADADSDGVPSFSEITTAINNLIPIPTPGSQSYTTPGTYSWTVPVGVTRVTVYMVGGGGGGGGSNVSTGASATAGGGGGSVISQLPVTPGASMTVVVGSGGGAGPVAPQTGTGIAGNGTGTNGGNSTFGGLTAYGGVAGGLGTGGTGGVGSGYGGDGETGIYISGGGVTPKGGHGGLGGTTYGKGGDGAMSGGYVGSVGKSGKVIIQW